MFINSLFNLFKTQWVIYDSYHMTHMVWLILNDSPNMSRNEFIPCHKVRLRLIMSQIGSVKMTKLGLPGTWSMERKMTHHHNRKFKRPFLGEMGDSVRKKFRTERLKPQLHFCTKIFEIEPGYQKLAFLNFQPWVILN